MHNVQKKIAVINDISGFGKCSMTVALPLISALGIQCCPVPTALFSNHTGYEEWFCEDLTRRMKDYWKPWTKLGLAFDGILSGYLSSVEQVQLTEEFIETFAQKHTRIIVDPVMGDEGTLYKRMDGRMQKALARLVRRAHIVTPNVTEACALTGIAYKASFSRRELMELAQAILEMGPEKAVITGISTEVMTGNVVAQRGRPPLIMRHKRAGENRCGTGDVFASVLAAQVIRGKELKEAVRQAAAFVARTIARSDALGMDKRDGVCFEEFLSVRL